MIDSRRGRSSEVFFPAVDTIRKPEKLIIRRYNRRKLSCAPASRESTELSVTFTIHQVNLIRLFQAEVSVSPPRPVPISNELSRPRVYVLSIFPLVHLIELIRGESIYRMHVDRDEHNISIRKVSLSFSRLPFFFMHVCAHFFFSYVCVYIYFSNDQPRSLLTDDSHAEFQPARET